MVRPIWTAGGRRPCPDRGVGGRGDRKAGVGDPGRGSDAAGRVGPLARATRWTIARGPTPAGSPLVDVRSVRAGPTGSARPGRNHRDLELSHPASRDPDPAGGDGRQPGRRQAQRTLASIPGSTDRTRSGRGASRRRAGVDRLRPRGRRRVARGSGSRPSRVHRFDLRGTAGGGRRRGSHAAHHAGTQRMRLGDRARRRGPRARRAVDLERSGLQRRTDVHGAATGARARGRGRGVRRRDRSPRGGRRDSGRWSTSPPRSTIAGSSRTRWPAAEDSPRCLRIGRPIVRARPQVVLDCPVAAEAFAADHFGPLLAVRAWRDGGGSARPASPWRAASRHRGLHATMKRTPIGWCRSSGADWSRSTTAFVPSAHPATSIAPVGESGWGVSRGDRRPAGDDQAGDGHADRSASARRRASRMPGRSDFSKDWSDGGGAASRRPRTPTEPTPRGRM